MRNILLRQKRKKIVIPGKEPALMKGAGGRTIEKIQNKTAAVRRSIRGTAAISFYLPRKVCGRRTLHSFAGK